MDQQRKRERMHNIKSVLQNYGMKGTVSVKNHSTLQVNLTEGAIDVPGRHDINHFWIDKNYADNPVARDFLLELKDAMLGHDYFDKSDIMTDYFHCSHYINICVGRWNKPYVYKPELSRVA